jgi:hypothetical protein
MTIGKFFNERNHNMNNIRKRMIAIAVVACMALPFAVSCSSNSVGKGGSVSSSSTSETSSEDDPENIGNSEGNMVITPFQTGSADDLSGLSDPNAPTDLDSDTTTTAAKDSKTTTAAATVTDESGKTVTTAATDKSGDAYVATAANNGDSNNNNNSNNNNSDNNQKSDYKSSTDSMYCLWIDISKDKNYVFNDKFIKITFKIKDGIPSQDYAVRFNPDFSSISGVSVHPDKVSQGTIRVGSGSIEAMDVSGEDGFVAYGDNIACNQGDTIDYYINLKNNPGLAAILVWFYYDKNAMEVVSVKPAGEFAEAAQNGDTQVGTRPAE